MEQASKDIPLEGLVWIPEAEVPAEVRKHPIGATLRTIKKIFKKKFKKPNLDKS